MGLENGIVGMNIARLSLKPTNIREGIKRRFFFGDLSQMWVGGVADSQTRSKPLQAPQITPKIAFFDPNFTFRPPKSKNECFFLTPSLNTLCEYSGLIYEVKRKP